MSTVRQIWQAHPGPYSFIVSRRLGPEYNHEIRDWRVRAYSEADADRRLNTMGVTVAVRWESSASTKRAA